MTDTPPAAATMADVQGSTDHRNLAIQRVGIKGLKHPLQFLNHAGQAVATVAEVCMTVLLPKERKGTHMSRFVQLLNEQTGAFDLHAFAQLLQTMTTRLDATEGHIELRFPYFITKLAPVSGVASLMDYQVGLQGKWANGKPQLRLQLVVPVTSLCPCSKEISDYGAHNQRSHISLDASVSIDTRIDDLISLLEAQASAELYGVLKRSDEKHVTERAYDNPKFVEDIIRDVANALNQHPGLGDYRLEVENFEAIHNHSAYAMIERGATE